MKLPKTKRQLIAGVEREIARQKAAEKLIKEAEKMRYQSTAQ